MGLLSATGGFFVLLGTRLHHIEFQATLHVGTILFLFYGMPLAVIGWRSGRFGGNWGASRNSSGAGALIGCAAGIAVAVIAGAFVLALIDMFDVEELLWWIAISASAGILGGAFGTRFGSHSD